MEFEPYPRQHFPMGNYASTGALDMSNMAATLPDYQMRQYQQQPYSQHYPTSGASNPSLMYQYHQGAQFAGQTVANTGHSFAQQYPSQFLQGTPPRQQQGAAYPHFISNPGVQGGQQQFQAQPFLLQQPLMHHAGSTTQHHQQQPHFSQSHSSGGYAGHYGQRVASGYALPQLRLDNSMAQVHQPNMYPQMNPQGMYPVFPRKKSL